MLADQAIPQMRVVAADVNSDAAAALERLYVAHRDAVVRYLRGIGTTDDEAFDLAAATFERAFRTITREPATELGLPWLLRTARNAAIDQARRRRTRDSVVRLLPGGSHGEGPEAMYVAQERALAVRMALGQLSSIERDAIVLRYATGLTSREIGLVLGRGEEATQKLISRGLARLREALDAAR